MVKSILFFYSLVFSSLVFAQYKVGPCTNKENAGETCVIKEYGSENFYAEDIGNLRGLAKKHPKLAWRGIMDSTGTLAKDLNDAVGTITKGNEARFQKALDKIKKDDSVDALLEGLEIYLESNPSARFNFKNKDKVGVETMVTTITGKPLAEVSLKPGAPAGAAAPAPPPRAAVESAAAAAPPALAASAAPGAAPKATDGDDKKFERCIPNQEKYKAIVDDMPRCAGTKIADSMGASSFYKVLAEIAACEKYEITQVGVVQTMTMRSIAKPCIVDLKDSNALIGAGYVELKVGDKIKKIDWNSGYDLFDKRNDIEFWRKQLLPQVQQVMSPPGTPGTGGNDDTTRKEPQRK